jgi:PAS domain S-box-containing protein
MRSFYEAERDPVSAATDLVRRSTLLQAIADSAMDALIILDAEQRIVCFNPAAEAMFRWPASSIIGELLNRILPQEVQELHRRHVVAFGATGGTTRSMGNLMPLTARPDGGERFPIEATISKVEVDGQTLFVSIVRDISERHKDEVRLRRQLDLLDLAYDAIFTWAWDGPITYWNRGAERLYGYSTDEAHGQVSHDLLQTEFPDGLLDTMAELERDRFWEGELTQRRRNGVEVLVESRHQLLMNGTGFYVLEVNRDITERRKDERRKGSASSAAHATAEWFDHPGRGLLLGHGDAERLRPVSDSRGK